MLRKLAGSILLPNVLFHSSVTKNKLEPTQQGYKKHSEQCLDGSKLNIRELIKTWTSLLQPKPLPTKAQRAATLPFSVSQLCLGDRGSV